MRQKASKGGETMFWDKEYNIKDKDVWQLLKQEGIAIGAFTGIIALMLVVGLVA